MGKEQLTVSDVLRFTRHDYLNDLQLILMHIDLGNPADAKQTILNATKRLKQRTMLDRLGLPEIENWITTFEWMYNVFQTTLSCDIEKGVREAEEDQVVAYLDNVFEEIVNCLDPIIEYKTHIDVDASEKDWSIRIKVHGKLSQSLQLPEKKGNFRVEETVTDNLLTLTVSGR